MQKTLSVAKLLGTDIRSRDNANILRAEIDGEEYDIVLDFEGVTFMSRSFTDELCIIMNENPQLSVQGMRGIVKNMYEAVSESRTKKRERKLQTSEITELKDLKSMQEFFLSL